MDEENYLTTSRPQSPTDVLQYLNEIGVAIALTNDDAMSNIFQRTNARVYDAMLGIDKLIADMDTPVCEGPDQVVTSKGLKPPNHGSWAEAYKAYMIKIISKRNDFIPSFIDDVLNTRNGDKTNKRTLAELTDEKGNLNQLGKGVKAFTEAYPVASRTFNADKLLVWPSEPTAITMMRRDDATSACSVTSTLSNSVSSSISSSGSVSYAVSASTSSVLSSTLATSTSSSSQASSTSSSTPTSTYNEVPTSSAVTNCSPASSTHYISRDDVLGNIESFCDNDIVLDKTTAKFEKVYKISDETGGNELGLAISY